MDAVVIRVVIRVVTGVVTGYHKSVSASAKRPADLEPNPTSKSGRRPRPLLRVVTSAILAAVVIYAVWLRGPFRSHKPSSANQPLKTLSPFSESTAFAWVPHYPGAALENISTKQTRDELTYGFNFRTADDYKQALAFYSQQLQAAGFKVKVNDSGDHGGDLHADADSSGRSFDAVAAKVLQGTGTEVGVTAVQR